MKYILLSSLLFLTFQCQNRDLKNGDIIFHESLSSQSLAIQKATHSHYSHMGILFQKDDAWYVYEAVQPVKLTPLEQWIRRGKENHYVVKRLKNAEKILTIPVQKKMRQSGEKYKGKDYDLFFEWSDNRIYCSELVWKIYWEATGLKIGKRQKLKDFDLSSAIVAAKLKERYGENIPMEETVISPEAMFRSQLLITVQEN